VIALCSPGEIAGQPPPLASHPWVGYLPIPVYESRLPTLVLRSAAVAAAVAAVAVVVVVEGGSAVVSAVEAVEAPEC